MEAIQPVGKNSRNKQQGYNFRSVDEVYNMIQPILAKHRVFSLANVLEKTREERETRSGGALIYTLMKVRFRFYTDDGSYVDTITEGEGMDSGDKSSNKAMTAAHKYAIIMMFSIPTNEERDGDHDSPEHGDPPVPKNKKPPADPKKILLSTTPENYTKVKDAIKAMPSSHKYANLDPEKLTIHEGRGLYKFIKLYINVEKGLLQLQGRDDVSQAEIKQIHSNLLKARTYEDLEILIEMIPAPKKTDVHKEVEEEGLPFK